MNPSEEIAAILIPWPEPDPDDQEYSEEQLAQERERAWRQRQDLAADLATGWDDPQGLDPLLACLAGARRRMLAAETEIRMLIAYGREFARPRPYRLADLADASGMSISGARTAYTPDEVEDVAEQIGRPARTTTEQTSLAGPG
jgi:hypothetical protein